MNRGTLIWIAIALGIASVAIILVTQIKSPGPEVASPPAPAKVVTEPAPRSRTETPESTPKASLISIAEPFIGTEACAKCHAQRYQSYLQTHHSRSLAKIDSSHTEKPGSYFHEPSKTLYEVLVSSKGVTHRESLRVATSPTTSVSFPASELPVKYVMGSGAFAKGYLLEDRGFLVQSPVTWYSEPQDYAMAPGYDVKDHLGTTRVITDQCVFCHAGIIARESDNNERFSIQELAIGCERCHGAGSEHAKLYEAKRENVTATDSSVTDSPVTDSSVTDTKIINPSHLDRHASESICAQCHLQGDIVVEAKGKTIWDFVPGEPLENTRKIYKVDKPPTATGSAHVEKTFVDHFDQLWQSECYKNSDTLTCITCHDPHHSVTDKPVSVVQTEHCMKCHTDEACKLEHDIRVEREQNVCFRCHMPSVASEVPHTATTNHQIAVYPRAATPEGNIELTSSTVRRLESPNAVDSVDQRSDSIAKALFELDGTSPDTAMKRLTSETLSKLKQLAADDSTDTVLHSLLARAYRTMAESTTEPVPDSKQLSELWKLAELEALETIRLESRPVDSRKDALEVLLARRFDEGQFELSARYGVELVQTQRNSKDGYNTALALARLQRFQEAESLLRESIRIDVRYAPPYQSLYKLYSAVNPSLAEQVRQAGMMLESWQASKNAPNH